MGYFDRLGKILAVSVLAAASLLQNTGAIAAGMLIMDNGGQGTSSTGGWGTSSGANPYGSSSVFSRNNGDSYSYSFALGQPGEYQVFARWTEWKNRRTSVPYDIHHVNGTGTVKVNQQTNGGQWQKLGSTWTFGSSATITIRSLGNGTSSADAIKLVYVGGANVVLPPAFPIDLRGSSPEQKNISINVSKPAGAGDATVTLATYDADMPGEGELIINGNGPIKLFGSKGISGNRGNSANISFFTPASYWKNGENSLVFGHTSTAGYVIDDVNVSFEPPAPKVGTGPGGNLTPSGPIVISGQRDVVVSGLHISNPKGRCIQVSDGAYNIVIENSEIGPCGDSAVYIHSSEEVTIRNNYIHDANEGILPVQANGINITKNTIEHVSSGVSTWVVKQIKVTGNSFRNMMGPYPNGQCVMFAKVTGGGNRINNNICANQAGASDPEDAINVYRSTGKNYDYIQVNGNIIVGGGPAKTGGGIILGDSGGAYQKAENNVVVNSGSYGISLSAGHHLILSKNKVLNVNDGSQVVANVGVIVGHQAKDRGFECRDLEFSNNEITFWKGENQLRGAPKPYLYPYYKWSGCGGIAGWGSNKFDRPDSQPANLDISILPLHLHKYVK